MTLEERMLARAIGNSIEDMTGMRPRAHRQWPFVVGYLLALVVAMSVAALFIEGRP